MEVREKIFFFWTVVSRLHPYMKITVRTIPSAAQDKVTRIDKMTYKVHVQAPSKEGKANRRLIKILAKHFDVPPTNITIKTGLGARVKIVEVLM